MKKYFLLALILFIGSQRAFAQLDTEIKVIAEELARKISETNLRKVAVTDLGKVDNKVSQLGRFLSEELNMYLPEAGRELQVIDRSQVNVLISELNLFNGGVLDRKAALKLGELVGIEALVYGSITAFTGYVKVNIMVLDIQKGIILRTVAGKITNTPDIIRLLKDTSVEPIRGNQEVTLPNPKRDCNEKPSCVVCVTNKSAQSIEVQPILSNNLNVYDGVQLLVHPGKFKCWEEIGFSVRGDHDTVRIDTYVDGNRVSPHKQIIEPCQVYNIIHE